MWLDMYRVWLDVQNKDWMCAEFGCMCSTSGLLCKVVAWMCTVLGMDVSCNWLNMKMVNWKRYTSGWMRGWKLFGWICSANGWVYMVWLDVQNRWLEMYNA